MIRPREEPSRGDSSSYRLVLSLVVVVLLIAALVAPPMEAGSLTKVSIGRSVGADAVTDPSGVLTIDSASDVRCEDGRRPLVNFTNRYNRAMDVQLVFSEETADIADLYLGTKFLGDANSFTLASGETKRFSAFATCEAEGTDLVFDVNATAFLLDVDADGRTVPVVGLEQDWPQFGNDTRNTGRHADNTGPRTSTTEKWTHTMGGATRGAPIMVDDTVFVGGSDSKLYAINAHNGSLEWTFTADGEVQGDPAYVAGTVYFGTKAGSVYAVDAATGSQDWQFTGAGDEILTPVVVEDGVAYAGSKDSKLYAVHTANGSQRWSATIGAEVQGVAVDPGGDVYSTDSNGDLKALYVGNGTVRWTYGTGNEITASPTVSGDRIYYGSKKGKTVHAVNLTGSTVWSTNLGNEVVQAVAVDGSSVYVADGGGTLWALNTSDGGTRWSTAIVGVAKTAPAIANGTVYVGSGTSTVAGFDATDGTEQFSHALAGPPVSGLAVAENYLYVGDGTDTVYALHAGLTLRKFYDENWPQFQFDATHTGVADPNVGPVGALSEKWSFAASGVISGGPAVADGIVYVATEGGNVYARYERNNTVNWSASPGGVFKTAPSVGATNVYVADDGGTLRAIWRTNGTTRWTFATGDTVFASPTVHAGSVFVGSKTNSAYAFWANGTQRWSKTDFGGEVRGGVSVTDDSVYVADRGGTVSALYESNGTERWTFSAGNTELLSAPAVVNGTVYVATRDSMTLHALDATDGTERWSYAVGQEVWLSMAVTPRTVFVSDNGGTIHAVRTDNGTARWTTAIGGTTKVPAVVDGVVYLADGGGTVRLLDADDGSALATHSLAAGAGESLAIANDQVYVGDANGNLYSIEGELNELPSAAFTSSPSDPDADESVSFDASGSSDEDGTIVSYEWDWTSDGTYDATGQTASYAYDWGGTYDVTLRVTDDLGGTDTVTKTVSVSNDEPDVDFTYDPANPDKGDVITFDGSVTVDGDGTVVSYEWDWTSDGTYDDTGEVVDHTYTVRGDYNVTLRVTDDDGATNTTTKSVTVTNTPPSASFTWKPDEPLVDQTTTFNGSSSSDPDGTVESYAWDWDGDGIYDATGESATHRFATGGTHQVTLRVTDDGGLNDTMTLNVTVIENWLQFQFDAQNTGSPANTGPTGSLVQNWTSSTGAVIQGGPGIKDQVLYVANDNGDLRALDEDNGSAIWASPYSTGQITTSPAIGSDTVYVGTITGAFDAVWIANGTQRWSFASGSEIKASPTLDNGTVYFGTKGGTLYAVNATTGTQLWSVDAGSEVLGAPAVADGVVYLGTKKGGTLDARYAANGTVKWSYSIAGEIHASATVVGETVYLGDKTGTVYAINASDGTARWSTDISGGELPHAPAVHDGLLYIGDNAGTLYAVHTTNGSVKWTYGAAGVVRAPAVVGGNVYVGNDGGTVYVVDASTGTEVTTYSIGAVLGDSLAVANGRVYVGDANGNVYALKAG